MQIFPDCLPCLLKQALDTARAVTDNVELHEKIMHEAVKALLEYKKYTCAPEMARAIHSSVKEITGVRDPFADIKARDIDAALKANPYLDHFLKMKQNDLYWALKISATGNIIDSAIYNNIDLESCLEAELEKKFKICDLELFEKKLETAENLLIIGDNAGETVFDRILAKRLSGCKITYGVRSGPIINDATADDAFASGLSDCTRIVSTGCDAPGAILEECSAEFMDIFNNADIVISKGQGNFEALSDSGRQLFFLLKAKCPMIAGRFGVDLNDYIFKCNKTSIDTHDTHDEKRLI